MSLHHLVIDLNNSLPHLQPPPWALTQLVNSAPPDWLVTVVDSTTRTGGRPASFVGDETLQALSTAEAYLGYGVDASLLSSAPLLQWAHSAFAGVGSAVTSVFRDHGVVLTNSAGVYGEPMADTVLAGVLYFARSFDVAVRLQAESRWDQVQFGQGATTARELNALRVLVIGAGGIGGAVARRFAALGCECTGVRRRPEKGVPEGFRRVVGPADIDAALPLADVVVVSAPSTIETKALLDQPRLALLPAGAIVVNVARGALVDEEALLERLDTGHLRGAVLDVFSTEPLPSSSRLWRHPLVLMTPHVSGVSPVRHWKRVLELFEDNWRRWVAGEALRNVVDLDAGY